MQQSAIDFLRVPQIIEIEKKLENHHGEKKLAMEYGVPLWVISEIKLKKFSINPPQLRIDPSISLEGYERETLTPEEEMLSSPFYGSSKHKAKTKLIKGWELFTYID